MFPGISERHPVDVAANETNVFKLSVAEGSKREPGAALEDPALKPVRQDTCNRDNSAHGKSGMFDSRCECNRGHFCIPFLSEFHQRNRSRSCLRCPQMPNRHSRFAYRSWVGPGLPAGGAGGGCCPCILPLPMASPPFRQCCGWRNLPGPNRSANPSAIVRNCPCRTGHAWLASCVFMSVIASGQRAVRERRPIPPAFESRPPNVSFSAECIPRHPPAHLHVELRSSLSGPRPAGAATKAIERRSRWN